MKFEGFLDSRTLSQTPQCLSGRQFECLGYLYHYFYQNTERNSGITSSFPLKKKKKQVYKGIQLHFLINQHLQTYLMFLKTASSTDKT